MITLKRIIFLAVAVVVALSCNAFAASLLTGKQELAVVIVGTSDYKTQDFFNSIGTYISEPCEGTKTKVLYGSDVQTKYQEYWLEKGELDEQRPNKQDLLDFVDYSGYDKVLYLILKDPVIDSHANPIMVNGIWATRQDTRASIGLNIFLVEKESLLIWVPCWRN